MVFLHSLFLTSVLTEQSDLVKNHTHSYTPSGKIASTNGGTDNKTSSPSSNAVTITDTGHSHSYFKWWQTGNASNSGGNWKVFPDGNGNSTTGDATTGITASHDHTHNAYFTGTKTSTEGNDTNALETRPKNYTIKIWKRTS